MSTLGLIWPVLKSLWDSNFGMANTVLMHCSKIVLHAGAYNMFTRQWQPCVCSVHHSHDAPHAAGLCAEPAAGVPHKRKLLAPGGGAPGVTRKSSLLPALQTSHTLGSCLIPAVCVNACATPVTYCLWQVEVS